MEKIKNHKTIVFFIAGCIAVLAAAVLSVLFGSTQIPLRQVLRALSHADSADHQHLVILELRIPRTIGCILVGAAFASAGAIMQGVTRNPLADSGLLGINAGATFALALCLALLPGIGFTGVVLFSFLGATAAMALLYCLMSMKHRKLDPVRLVLGGSAISIFLSSLSQAVSIFYNIGYDLTFWTSGGVAAIRMQQLYFAAPVILVGLAAAILLSGKVSLLSLGEDASRGLGLQVERSRVLCLAVVLLLAGGAVALAGPVAFVGLMVPHVMQYFVGADYRQIIPASMIGGAFFMLIADLVSRVINAPGETPIGLVFSVIGVPFFIWTARKGGKDFE
ncbi:MAG: iron ABC transporter permease [Lachnospiraceae bacterium]|nr:iron ABC transporter permease [Lachnospiraceae bacterium]